MLGTFQCSNSYQASQRALSRAIFTILSSHRVGSDTIMRKRSQTKSTRTLSSRASIPDQYSRWIEQVFIGSLVYAGRCQRHVKRSSSCFTGLAVPERCLDTSGRKSLALTSVGSFRRPYTSKSDKRNGAVSAQFNATREELKSLVDYYSQSWLARRTVDGSSRFVNAKATPLLNENSTTPIDVLDDPEGLVHQLEHTLAGEDPSHEKLFHFYQKLPEPRVLHLSNKLRHDLLGELSRVEYKSESLMLRFLSVVEDTKAAKIPLSQDEWNSVISYTGRCFKVVSGEQVENALYVWKAMENEAGVRGTTVTFNILFDIATKAGKFVLAEMILKEMEQRKLRMNLHTHVGLIYYSGLRGDGDGVRKAYRDLVDAGEFVNTVVISCVIAALLKCGEVSAAEQVFERSKVMHSEKSNRALPPSNWREGRNLSKLLGRAARTLVRDSEDHQQLQDTVSLAPNLRTYKILIRYHCVVTGDIDRVSELVAEMYFYQIPLEGSIFLYLFKGFSIHGGALYTSWTRRRLENTWSSFIKAVQSSTPRVYLSVSAIQLVTAAFARCTGKFRTMEVWDEVDRIWERSEDESSKIDDYIQELVHDLEER